MYKRASDIKSQQTTSSRQMSHCFSFLSQMFSMENHLLGVEAGNPNVQSPNGETLMDADAYFDDKFPPGYRFKPHDNELVVCYLQRKINNEPLPPNRIEEVELYKFNPETLAECYRPLGENEWYFFTPRDRKYRGGKRPNRAAADGYWKATGADKRVENNDVLVGFKKALVFYRGKSPKGDKTNWIMHEFRVDTPPIIRKEDMRLDNWVLCRIYKKKEKDRSRQGTSTGQEDDSIQDDQQSETEFQDSEAFDMAVETCKPQDPGLIDMSGYGYGNQGRFYHSNDNAFLHPQSAYNPGLNSMWHPEQNSTWIQQTFPPSNQNLNEAESLMAAAARPAFLPMERNMKIERPTFQSMESNMKLERFNEYLPFEYLDISPEDSYLDDPFSPI